MNEMLAANGFEDAVIGVGSRPNMGPILCYDYVKCVEILVRDQEMTQEDAEEWMDYNVVSAWMGEGTPMFIYPYDPEDYE